MGTMGDGRASGSWRYVAALGCAALMGSPAESQRTTTYAYDALGRLTSVSSLDATASYRCDAAGNRQQVTLQAGPPTTLNGDFEAPQVNNYALLPNAPDLSFKGRSRIAANGGDWHFPTSWFGNQVAFLQSSDNDIGWVEVKAVRLVVGKRYQSVFAAA